MMIVRTRAELERALSSIREKGASIGLVPTMGALHEGHLSLIKKAKAENEFVAISIFVNPLQFAPEEDFDSYPRDFERDRVLAERAGCDLIFHPSVEEMYPSEPMQIVHVQKGAGVLCGKSRPGHFDGVATVVLKLFGLFRPTRAYFGQKDAQQVAIITQLVREFYVPIEVVAAPTVREEDGLARSSRNVRLTPEERAEAPRLSQALQKAKRAVETGEQKRTSLVSIVEEELQQFRHGAIDYVEALSYPELHEQEELSGQAIIALAYQFSKVRLIDHILVEVRTEKRGDANVSNDDESKVASC
ncbi:pantoate--beta-alanine ligase [Shouchella shacheensis]|uniref:pantoate--beta-alanine ligase n=1 Tax=Shouchella shacheensis TaxID=1649580 RepID=UPI0007401F86|nr:pantoate--beta-alanine ligase [Shouchella shacheensis]